LIELAPVVEPAVVAVEAHPRIHSWAGPVLVAEDNAMNQLVLCNMLDALGVDHAVAENGLELLKLWMARQSDSLVLMDCNMPEMDGFEATGELRNLENRLGCKRMPIIALTANAMRGDRERCLAAGMDDHLAKPYTLGQLEELLVRWWTREPQAETGAADRDTTPPQRTVNSADTEIAPPASQRATGRPSVTEPRLRAEALEQIRRVKPELVAAVVDRFMADVPGAMAQMEEALQNNEAGALVISAHTLKANAATVGADLLANCFAQIEALAHDSLDGIEPLLAQARQLYDQVEFELVSISGG